MHGRDIVVTMVTGTTLQRSQIQDALDRWWGPLMQMHGPRARPGRDHAQRGRLKGQTSGEHPQELHNH
jgi:1,2-phenylacetyl-CoA epoxidase catalytic subunit